MNILGQTRIFKKEINGRDVFSTSISNKKEDGTYENMYVGVQFKKDEQPNVWIKSIKDEQTINSCNIDIKKGFLSFYLDKNGAEHIKFIILEYEILEKEETEAEFQVSTNDCLPF